MEQQINKMTREKLSETIFNINNDNSFEEISLSVFKFQYNNCIVYQKYCDILQKTAANINKVDDIPFMPVDFFRHHAITCLSEEPELFFSSSTTTGSVPSRHMVAYSEIYNESIKQGFCRFFGEPSEYCILALLPGYLERGNSSLVYMVKKLMEWSGHEKNGFYLYEHNKLKSTLEEMTRANEKVLLIGVSHALLDFAENNPINLKNTIVMETGGMKGRRKELIRRELHDRLKKSFGIKHIVSEYGMTELLSQAYAMQNGMFKTPPWMKVFFREISDPFSNVLPGKTGVINIIDLANVFSCSFIGTQDLGKQIDNSAFEVLGRLDKSEIRGCNLMIA